MSYRISYNVNHYCFWLALDELKITVAESTDRVCSKKIFGYMLGRFIFITLASQAGEAARSVKQTSSFRLKREIK